MVVAPSRIQVTVVFSPGCDHTPPTVDLVNHVAAELSLPINITMVRVSTQAEAVRFHMHGSPTVLVDGQDIDPAMRNRTDYGFT